MKTANNNSALSERVDPTSLVLGLGDLFPGIDQRTSEQQREAERKERARRTGKSRKDWWKS